jgi:hypothetical protein
MDRGPMERRPTEPVGPPGRVRVGSQRLADHADVGALGDRQLQRRPVRAGRLRLLRPRDPDMRARAGVRTLPAEDLHQQDQDERRSHKWQKLGQGRSSNGYSPQPIDPACPGRGAVPGLTITNIHSFLLIRHMLS